MLRPEGPELRRRGPPEKPTEDKTKKRRPPHNSTQTNQRFEIKSQYMLGILNHPTRSLKISSIPCELCFFPAGFQVDLPSPISYGGKKKTSPFLPSIIHHIPATPHTKSTNPQIGDSPCTHLGLSSKLQTPLACLRSPVRCHSSRTFDSRGSSQRLQFEASKSSAWRHFSWF